MKLHNPTDDQLDAAFAEKVAGWGRIVTFELSAIDTNGLIFGRRSIPAPLGAFEKDGVILEHPPRFTRSFDAVLPWLGKYNLVARFTRDCGRLSEHLSRPEENGKYFINIIRGGKEHEAIDKTLPRAACIALLRAHGHEVTFAP